MAEFRGSQEKGEVLGGWEGGLLEIHCPLGALMRLPPPPRPNHAGLVHLVAIILLEGGGE